MRDIYVFRASVLKHVRSQAHLRGETTGHIHVRFWVDFTGLAVPETQAASHAEVLL